jgi:ribose transport system substrate-binding protein
VVAASAGCGSSSEPTSSPGKQGSTSVDTSLEATRQRVMQAQEFKTGIPLKTPLKEPPTKGKTFVWLACDTAGVCDDYETGVREAVEAAGWNLKVITWKQSDPATLVSAMKQALQYDPIAVSFSGADQAFWQQVIPEYKAAGVTILPMGVGEADLSSTVPAAVSGPEQSEESGRWLADYTAISSGGSANVLVFTATEFPIVKSTSDSYLAHLKQVCPKCQTRVVNGTSAQVAAGQAVPLVVSNLQANPSVDYLMTSVGVFLEGLPSALAAAGLAGRVKVIGNAPSVQNESDILTGNAEAFVAANYKYLGWLVVDEAIRISQGMPPNPSGGNAPRRLLTKAVMKDNNITPSTSLDYPVEFRKEFKKLWMVQR